jgi:hypothetical protein
LSIVWMAVQRLNCSHQSQNSIQNVPIEMNNKVIKLTTSKHTKKKKWKTNNSRSKMERNGTTWQSNNKCDDACNRRTIIAGCLIQPLHHALRPLGRVIGPRAVPLLLAPRILHLQKTETIDLGVRNRRAK